MDARCAKRVSYSAVSAILSPILLLMISSGPLEAERSRTPHACDRSPVTQPMDASTIVPFVLESERNGWRADGTFFFQVGRERAGGQEGFCLTIHTEGRLSVLDGIPTMAEGSSIEVGIVEGQRIARMVAVPSEDRSIQIGWADGGNGRLSNDSAEDLLLLVVRMVPDSHRTMSRRAAGQPIDPNDESVPASVRTAFESFAELHRNLESFKSAENQFDREEQTVRSRIQQLDAELFRTTSSSAGSDLGSEMALRQMHLTLLELDARRVALRAELRRTSGDLRRAFERIEREGYGVYEGRLVRVLKESETGEIHADESAPRLRESIDEIQRVFAEFVTDRKTD